jgi:transposase
MTVIGGIAAADRRLADRAAADPVVTRLRTAPGIGSLTAVAFVATLDAVGRFVAARTSDCPRQLVTCVR